MMLLLLQRLVQPVYFYINSIFALHAMLVWALFATAYMLSGSWLSGILTACFYIFNRLDTTRVEYTIPLRESFSLPFLWVQIAAISFYFRPNSSGTKEKVSVGIIAGSTLFFSLFWQFNQFILMLQAFALFGVWILDMIPARKGDELKPCNMPARIFKVIAYSISVLVLMVLINTALKILLNVEADEHIFKFLTTKFGLGHYRDFDSRLYLCIDAFGFLSFDTYERLTKGLVFPFYVAAHIILLIVLFVAVLQNWSNHVHDTNVKDHTATKKSHLLSSRPELAFHTVQAVFFGALAISTLRMKYLWTPYMCILASFGISDYKMWRAVLSQLKTQGLMVQIVRHFATLLTLAALLALALPPVLKELEDLKEFWDPDTVELMEWIKKSVPLTASFTGSMQLLAGVKLCTGRPITNHPHYEDKELRIKTKELYQIYGRRSPEDVHAILKKHQSNYIILEDSICLAPSRGGCRLPDLIDYDNGVIPDSGKPEPGLVRSHIPRFCDEIRKGTPEYTKYFKYVFGNKTFRVHKVL
ncbi:hypothetical protein KUTeg_014639 [Tegillarca granosa]|uniref:C-mannosyltransferase DPY19L3 n=1 Tax=Tegillarca granosa TaxID=220873 RepID=A0ABQ9ERF1_TEGGR|nr:hypothetical protein KUTeg_014639 [Tegillarca granosa]